MKAAFRHLRTAFVRPRQTIDRLSREDRAALEDAARSILFKLGDRWRPQNNLSAPSHGDATIDRLVAARLLFVLDENNSVSITFTGRRIARETARRRATLRRMQHTLADAGHEAAR